MMRKTLIVLLALGVLLSLSGAVSASPVDTTTDGVSMPGDTFLSPDEGYIDGSGGGCSYACNEQGGGSGDTGFEYKSN